MRRIGIAKETVLRHTGEISNCDDRLGQFSDHEGNEDGPAYYFWTLGYEELAEHCKNAIQLHKDAIRAWRKYGRLNERRKLAALRSKEEK